VIQGPAARVIAAIVDVPQTLSLYSGRADKGHMKSPACALALAAAIGASACSTPVSRAELPSGIPAAPATVRVGVTEKGQLTIRTVPLEEYVQAAVLSEFAPAAGDPDLVERMLEVQAIISRTYAVANQGRHARDGYDLCDTTHCQLFQPSRLKTSRWAPQAADAIRRTSGGALWYDGAPAVTVFHADCGGHTSAAADVWGGTDRPYLTGMSDDGPAAAVHATWHYQAVRSAIQRALNGDPRTRVGSRLDGVEILERDPAGRAEKIALHGAEERIVRGEALREVLTAAFGARTIRSTWFDVHRQNASIIFEGRGFGHGVGLCQAGALACIRAGANLTAILQRYFPGTTLVTMVPAS
jgi:stage II sporulation protein D